MRPYKGLGRMQIDQADAMSSQGKSGMGSKIKGNIRDQGRFGDAIPPGVRPIPSTGGPRFCWGGQCGAGVWSLVELNTSHQEGLKTLADAESPASPPNF